MTTPKKVLFATKEAAEAQTGHFRVSSLMITNELAAKVDSYISRNRLQTFSQSNKRKTSHNIYTLNFTLKQYRNTENPKSYLSKPGAIGYYKSTIKTEAYRINPGSPESYVSIHSPSDENIEKYESLKARSPTLEQMYFWIVRKYPNDLLWMDFSMKPNDVVNAHPDISGVN